MKKDTKELEELLVNTLKSSLTGLNDSNIDLKIDLYYEEWVHQYPTGGVGVAYTPKIILEIKTGNRA